MRQIEGETGRPARIMLYLSSSTAFCGTHSPLRRFRARRVDRVHYQGIEYVVRQRADGEWEWIIRTPLGPDKSGVTRGTRRWAETVVHRSIDVWWLMNPNMTDVSHAAE
jgi:hypothetical protein